MGGWKRSPDGWWDGCTALTIHGMPLSCTLTDGGNDQLGVGYILPR